MPLTRRELAAVLASGTALAQTAPHPPETPDELLKAARERVRTVGELLAKEQVPVAVEPAFQFKA